MAGQAVDLGSVYATLQLKTSGFEQSAKKAETVFGSLETASLSASRTLQAAGKKSADAFNGVADSAMSIIKPLALATAAGSFGLGTLIKFGFNATREIQETTAGIISLTGSAESAGKVIKQMVDYVQGKPFDRLEVIKASRQLLAMGRTTQDLTGDIDLLGKAVILTGGGFEQLAQIYGQAASSNRIMSGELNQLEANGIPITLKLAESLGITAQQVRELAEKGKIDFKTFRVALDKALPADIVANASNTINQRMSSLSASFRNLAFDVLGVDFSKMDGRPLVTVGGLLDNIIDGIESLIVKLREPAMRETFRKMGEQLTMVAKNVIPKLLQLFGFILLHLNDIVNTTVALAGVWAGAKVASMMSSLATIAGGAITAATGFAGMVKQAGLLGGAFSGLIKILSGNFVFLVVIGVITILATKFYELVKQTGSVSAAMKKLGDKASTIFGDIKSKVAPVLKSIADNAVVLAGKITSYLVPKIVALWNAFQQLIPVLVRLWQQVIVPLVKVIGTTFVLAIGAAIDVMKIVFNVLNPLINIVLAFKDMILYTVVALGTLKIALAIQGLIATLGSGFVAATIHTLGFKGAIEALTVSANPLVLVLTGIATAFALLNHKVTASTKAQIELMEAEGKASDARAEAAATKFKEVAKAYNDIATEAQSYLSITNQLKYAEDEVKAATERLTEAIRLHGEGSQQAKDAQAQLSAAEADLKQKQVDRKVELDKLIESTKLLTSLSGPFNKVTREQMDADLAAAIAIRDSARADGEKTDAIDKVIETLKGLIEIKDQTVTTNYDSTEIMRKLHELQDKIGLVPKSTTTVSSVIFKSDTSQFKLPDLGAWKGVPYKLPGNARGTNNWRGGMTWVGENGPEIVNLPRGSQVIPNHKVNTIIDEAKTSGLTVYGDINIANQQDADYLLQRLSRKQDLTVQGLVGA